MRKKQRSLVLNKAVILTVSATFLLGGGYVLYPFWHRYGFEIGALVQVRNEKARTNFERKLQFTSDQRDDSNAVINKEFFNYLASQLRDTPYPGIDSYIQYTVVRKGLKSLSDVKELRSEYGSVINDVTSFKYLIEPPCQAAKTKRRSLFVATISAPYYFNKRHVIRNTWRRLLAGNYSSDIEVVGFGFVVGTAKNAETQEKIKQESEKYGDILQVEMVDTYYNLTLKMAGLIYWMHSKCSQSDYVLKVDDDIYVNVRNLVAVITSNDPSVPQVFGSGINNPPLRTGKWGLGYDEWPWSEYPYYLSGAAILMTRSAIVPLLTAVQVVPFFPFEDVYLTGLCLEKTNVTAMHSPRMLVQNTNLKYQVQDSVTWLTDSASQMFKLHLAANQFYKQASFCSDSTANTAPTDLPTPCMIDFEFTPYVPELYMHV